MSDETRRYRIWLKEPQQIQLLRMSERFPKEGYERLKKAIRSAQVRVYPGDEMSRADRAQWVADELLESISEVETLLEEVQDWVQATKGTGFAKTAMYDEVTRTEMVLEASVATLHDVRASLQTTKFPHWQGAKEAADRQVAQVQERLKHERRK